MTDPDSAKEIPDYQSFMLPVLRATENGEVRLGEAVRRVADELALSDAARAMVMPSGREPLLANRVRWAKTYLTKAGLLESNGRGHFQITGRGRDVLAAKPERIDNRFLSRFDEFRQFTDRTQSSAEDGPTSVTTLVSDQTPDEIMRTAHRPQR